MLRVLAFKTHKQTIQKLAQEKIFSCKKLKILLKNFAAFIIFA